MTKAKYDATSGEPVLFLTGSPVENVPARDLSGSDLARLAWVGLDPRPNLPTDVPASALSAVADQLVKSGSYTTSESAGSGTGDES